MTGEVTILGLGQRGDGLADIEGRRVHVPGALSGETVTVEVFGETAHLLAVTAPSPDRLTPFCPHFGVCGGCRMQHAGPAHYGPWKRGLVEAALRHARIEAPLADLVLAHGTGRRRVTLHVRFERGRAQAGFMAAKTHDLVDLVACPVLEPRLTGAPDLARALARPFAGMGKPLDIQLTATDGGIDADIRGSGKVDAPLRLRLTELATQHDLARLSIHGDVVVERRPALVRFGKAAVNAPPGGFLQATAAGEEALAALVLGAFGKEKRVADLFSGAGPFALRIAATRAVSAFDSDRPAIEALTRAANGTQGLKPIAAEARDLFRRPLLAHELKAFDALVLDPPRAGAEAQVRQIAAARANALVVYVSCDPQSFARDAALLVGAGYRLEQVTPVDQFAWSAHVELVGIFRLPGR